MALLANGMDEIAALAALDNLNAMLAAGVTRASYDGRSVEYASFTELRRARDELARLLGLAIPARRTVAKFSNGFGPSWG